MSQSPSDWPDRWEAVARQAFKAARAFTDELASFAPSPVGPHSPIRSTPDETLFLIQRLNQAGIMVSIDYEPGGTYSVSLLRLVAGDNCWSAVFNKGSQKDLLATLTDGALVVGVPL